MFDALLSSTRRSLGPTAWLASNFVSPEYAVTYAEQARLARANTSMVQAVVRRRLHRYLKFCREYSPFWRERWPARWEHFRVEESEAVLAELPTLHKEDLRNHRDALHIPMSRRRAGDGYPRSPGQFETRSGGSTGVPSAIWHDLRFGARNRSLIDAAYRSVGVWPGRPTFYLWGSVNELGAMQSSMRKRVSTWARGLIALPSFTLGPVEVRAHADTIARHTEVDQAICFVPAVDTLTRIAEHEGIPLRRVRQVITGGGKLHDEVRARVRRVWADDVVELYGTRDVGLVGVENLDHEGIEVYPWHNYVELLHEGRRVGDGETGEVHVTMLNNYAFAVLRMSLGDLAQQRDARAGWNRPRIANIVGRHIEHLAGRDGRRVDPGAVIHLIGVMEARPWVRRFQLRQRAPNDATLLLELWQHPGEEAIEAYRKTLCAALSRILEADLVLRVEVVSEIVPSASGKHFYCVGPGAAI